MLLDEWVLVEEDTPNIEKGLKAMSRNVIAKLESGETVKAYYDYYNYLWRYERNSRIIKEKVIAWRDK